MRKVWRTLSRSESKKEKQAVRAEKGKPGKPVPVERYVTLEPSTFRANLMEARREGYFADVILEGARRDRAFCSPVFASLEPD